MPVARALLLSVLLFSSAGCRKSEPTVPSPVDCGEDFECLVQRAEPCHPTSALLRQRYTVEGKPLEVLARYEVVGWVRGYCHVRRIQLQPPPPPPAPLPPPGPDTEYLSSGRPQPPMPPYPTPGKPPAPLLQCLYSKEQVRDALVRARENASTLEDLTPCYPGEGSCESVPIPLLGPGCVLGDCLLNRWTFTCEDLKDPKLSIYACEGTRLSDENPHCFLYCRRGSRFELDCRKPKP